MHACVCMGVCVRLWWGEPWVGVQRGSRSPPCTCWTRGSGQLSLRSSWVSRRHEHSELVLWSRHGRRNPVTIAGHTSLTSAQHLADRPWTLHTAAGREPRSVGPVRGVGTRRRRAGCSSFPQPTGCLTGEGCEVQEVGGAAVTRQGRFAEPGPRRARGEASWAAGLLPCPSSRDAISLGKHRFS